MTVFYSVRTVFLSIIHYESVFPVSHVWLTWSFWSIFSTLECTLSEALCHPGQHLSTVSDLQTENCQMTHMKQETAAWLCVTWCCWSHLSLHGSQSLLLVLEPSNNPQQALNPRSQTETVQTRFNAANVCFTTRWQKSFKTSAAGHEVSSGFITACHPKGIIYLLIIQLYDSFYIYFYNIAKSELLGGGALQSLLTALQKLTLLFGQVVLHLHRLPCDQPLVQPHRQLPLWQHTHTHTRRREAIQ